MKLHKISQINSRTWLSRVYSIERIFKERVMRRPLTLSIKYFILISSTAMQMSYEKCHTSRMVIKTTTLWFPHCIIVGGKLLWMVWHGECKCLLCVIRIMENEGIIKLHLLVNYLSSARYLLEFKCNFA